MPLEVGRRLGPYEITSAIGAGGMGEVYRARDTKLNRDVALKVLPDAFALDADRLARFKREAQLLASLNHPHIAAIYGFEDSGEVHALVLELVEGPTLADRIAQGPVPLDEAVPIARQIAEALEAAHEQGIVHRDLKPANIKLRPDGTVKVLDFGLAKAVDQSGASLAGERTGGTATMSPTIMSPAMTQLGVILGTAAYMSPEQAKGHAADKRSDVWAFGCVLYEMFTARRAFEAGDISDTLAAVLRAEPDWAALPRDVPASIRALLLGCLTKDRRERIGDVSTALFLLKQPHGAVAPAAVAASSRRRTLLAGLALATAVIGGIAGVVAGRLSRPPVSLPVTRFSIPLGENERFATASRGVAISPDGSRIAYNPTSFGAESVGSAALYLRPMAALQPRQLGPAVSVVAGTFGQPIFSPDGEWIAFVTGNDRTLKKISMNGGAPLNICQVETQPVGVTWYGNTIVFAERGVGIMRVVDTGGPAETIVRVNPPELAIGPQLINQGRSLLFTLATETGSDRWDKAAIVVQSLQSGQRSVVLRGGADARYVRGRLVYAVGNTLWAVAFDEASGRTLGSPVPVVEGVSRATTGGVLTGQARFAISDSGTLVYVPGSGLETSVNRLLVRAGGEGVERVLPVPPQPYQHPRISPNGKQLAFATDDGKEAVIWVIDDLAAVTRPRRLTFQGRNLYPIWTPDGRYITFQSDREGDHAVFRQPADGTLPVERLTKPEPGTYHVPGSWSPDGRILAFASSDPSSKPMTIWTISLDGDRVPKPVAEPQGRPAFAPVFSRDGKWLAYSATMATGAPPNVFLQPFPPTGTKYQLSVNVGTGALWSMDGKQILYEVGPGAGNRLMRINVQTSPSVGVGAPVPVEFGRPLEQNAQYRAYDISPDGKQFIFVSADDTGTTAAQRSTQINVVENWLEELKQRVPAK